MSVDRTKLLAYWIRERREILAKRRAGRVAPWTDDIILRNYRFTNVRREDDAVTIWISENWRRPYWNHPNLTAAMVLARLLNNPDSLGHIGFPKHWDAQRINAAIKFRRSTGAKILNPAYVVTTCGVAMDKVDYIVNLASEVQQHGRPVYAGESLESYHSLLMTFKGLGTFLAGQVVADLKNTNGNALQNAPDWWAWAAVGPGSLRGLRAALARPDVSLGHFLQLATKLYADVQEQYGEPLNLCMQDFQNCLCEFSKYWKAYNNVGTPKQRYHGG